MKNEPLKLMQRIRFRLSKKVLLDAGAFYRYYATTIHGKPAIVQVNPHSKNPDFRTITVEDYLRRFRKPEDIDLERRTLHGLGFDV